MSAPEVNNRISKKELLEQTGISYGQLYRWKRERLIPEDWFIKQSAFTGQETYFPREQVLTRVQAILSLKDSHSLEDMAKIFSPDPQSTISTTALANFEALNISLLELLQNSNDIKTSYDTGAIVFLTALSDLISNNKLDCSEAVALAKTALSAAGKSTPATTCVLFRSRLDSKGYHVVFSGDADAPLFDSNIDVVGTLALQEAAERLGSYLQGLE